MNDHSKLIITLLVIITATALLWMHRLDGPQWVSTITWSMSVFMIGQVGAVVATGWVVSTAAKANTIK